MSSWIHAVVGIIHGQLSTGSLALPVGVTIHQFYELATANKESAKRSAMDALYFVVGHGVGECCTG